MERALVTYSLIRALYDEGRDYVDSFWPFAVRVLPSDRSPMTPQTVADLVTDRFGLSVPVHTTRTLLERAKQRGRYVVRRDKAYALTDAGLEYVGGMETPRSVERRIASFVEAASVYLASNWDIFADRDFTQEVVDRVLRRGAELLSFVVERKAEDVLGAFTAEEEAVLGFFHHVEEADPTQYDTLRDLLLGSTLAGLLGNADLADAGRHFRRTTLYLDTNVLLSVLELRFPVECRPSLELLRLLNMSARFSLMVFDFTLEELFGLLRGFEREGKKYPSDVPVASLYASMKSQGWTPGQVTELIAKIEARLDDLGIGVLSTGIRVDDIGFPDGDLLARLRSYKPEQEDRGRLHDLQAIAWVAQERTRAVRRVEDAEVFFLTEDSRLSKFAYIERGHRDGETISEVMPDRLLTNLLWLKNPEVLDQLPVEAVIAMHSRDLFIDKTVWLRFFGLLSQLTESGRLDEAGASVLLYDAQVHRDLAGLGVGRLKEVDNNWILDRLQGAREAAEWKQERALLHQAGELKERFESTAEEREARHALEIAALGRRLRAVETENESRRAEAVATLAGIKQRAKRQGGQIVVGVKVAVVVLLAWLTLSVVPLVLTGWAVAEPVIAVFQLLPFVALALGWKFDPFQFWSELRTEIEEALIDRKVRRLPSVISEFGRSHEPAQSGRAARDAS